MHQRCCKWIAWSAPAAFLLLISSPAAADDAAARGVALAADASATATAPAGPLLQPLDDSTLLILSVELDGVTLTEGLGAYGDPADPLLPIGELTRLLELDVDALPKDQRVTGRIGEARRSLIVDIKNHVARLGAQDIPLRPGDLAMNDNDIYARLSLLARLLPVKANFDSANQLLHLVATEKLPIQGRLERVARARQGSSGQAPGESTLKVPAPYRLLSLPAFDVGVSVGRQTTTPRQLTSAEIRVAADVLYSDFQGYFGTDESGKPQSARVLFERKSATGLLGPFKLRTIDVGDVYTPALQLGPRGLGGRGLFISTIPADQGSVFHQIDLRGELPLGYDIELYVNDVLRSGQGSRNNGRYEFLAVPLSSGVNVIRIVTYGPRGERNEQTRVINLGGGQLAKGDANFEFGVVQQEVPVLRVAPVQPADLALPTAHGLRATAALNYGLTANLTVNLGGAFTPTLTGDRKVVTAGARTSVFGVYTQIDLAKDLAGGEAGALGLSGKLFNQSWSLRDSLYHGGFVNEGGPGFTIDRLIKMQTELTLDGSVPLARVDLPYSFRAQRISYSNGDADFTGELRSSTTVRGYYVSGGFTYGRQQTGPTAVQTLAGYFAVSTFKNFKTQVRATLDYDIIPTPTPRTLAITLDRALTSDISLRLGLGEDLTQLKSVSVSGGAIFRLPVGDLSLNGNYSNADRSWSLGAQMNFGLGYDPGTHRYEMGPSGPASNGSVAFHAFMDDNGNGRFDPGEEPVPDVVVEGGDKPATTGKDGRVFIPSAGAGPSGRLRVSLEKVDELSLSAPPSNIDISPRAGGSSTVEYPIRPTGEVLVNVKLRRPDGQVIGLSAVNVRVQGDGGFVTEAATEFDGGAYFESIPIGSYTVTLDPEQAKQLRMNLKAAGVAKVERNGFPKPVELEVTFSPAPDETSAPDKPKS